MQLRLGFCSANESHGPDGKGDGKTAFFLDRDMIQSITHELRKSIKEILSKRMSICRTLLQAMKCKPCTERVQVLLKTLSFSAFLY